jgi:hypothetical protein
VEEMKVPKLRPKAPFAHIGKNCYSGKEYLDLWVSSEKDAMVLAEAFTAAGFSNASYCEVTMGTEEYSWSGYRLTIYQTRERLKKNDQREGKPECS